MKNEERKIKIIKTVFASRDINGPNFCSPARALVLANVTRVKTGAVVTQDASILCSSLTLPFFQRVEG